MDSLMDKLERKFYKFSISNLMEIIVFGMGLVYIVDLVLGNAMHISVSSMLAFDRGAILHGQIWRLITFIFIPPNSSILFILLSLYFYWMVGNGLENQWGSFKFNVFYICGILGTVIAGFITGYATNNYLNLSLFLAFALIYPDYQVLFFGILPLKVKYLAIIDAVAMAAMLVSVPWQAKIAIVVALGNVLLFFWGSFNDTIKRMKRQYEWRKNYRN